MPRPKRSGYKTQTNMANLLDQVSEFESWRTELLPKLRAMIEKGATPEAIYKEAAALAAAKAVTIALTETDSAKSLSAIKEIIDRSHGKSIDRKEINARMSTLSDAELDSLIKSGLGDLEDEQAH